MLGSCHKHPRKTTGAPWAAWHGEVTADDHDLRPASAVSSSQSCEGSHQASWGLAWRLVEPGGAFLTKMAFWSSLQLHRRRGGLKKSVGAFPVTSAI